MQLYNIKLKLEWDDASQTYSVTSPDVPELFTFGENLAEIQANVQEAIEVLLDGLKELGKEPPAALSQPISSSIIQMPVLADDMPLAA